MIIQSSFSVNYVLDLHSATVLSFSWYENTTTIIRSRKRHDGAGIVEEGVFFFFFFVCFCFVFCFVCLLCFCFGLFFSQISFMYVTRFGSLRTWERALSPFAIVIWTKKSLPPFCPAHHTPPPHCWCEGKLF